MTGTIKKHVCYMVGTYPPFKCGVGDYCANLANHVRNHSMDVTVLTSNEITGTGNGNGIKVVPMIREWRLKEVKKIISFCRDNHVDILHIQFPSFYHWRDSRLPNLLPVFLRWIFPSLKVVTTIHEFGIYPWKGRMRELLGIIASHKTIMVDPRDIELAHKMAPGTNGKITWIPVGPNISINNTTVTNELEVRKFFGLHKKTKIVFYFGSIHNQVKGIESGFRAIKILKSWGIPVVYLIVGDVDFKNNVYHKHLEKLVRNEGLEQQVLWEGYLDPEQVSQLMKIADVGLYPFRDGASFRRTSLVCTMKAGIPVVTTYHPKYTSTSFRHEENCLLAQVDDYHTMAEHVKKLFQSRSLYNRIKANAFNMMASFEWETIAQKHVQLYKQILSPGAVYNG